MDLANEKAYNTPFSNSPLLPLLLMSLAIQRNAPKLKTTFKNEYDYIIVGAGSAGSVMANRLSEVPCVSVLLLEAGRPAPLLDDVPGIGTSFWFSDIDWQYKTVPQKHTGEALINRQVGWPSGKGLGGSSLLNAMLFIRGNRKNYDDWAAQGAKGWSFQDVWPYFMKLEDNRNREFVENGYHNVSGPLTVELPRYQWEMYHPIWETINQLGYQGRDCNTRQQTGFDILQGTTRNGQRCSTAKAYLVPAENRTNLDILPYAHVRKVLFEGNQAVGVQLDYGGNTYEVSALREVILSAGAINSAQLLMLSGIGPKEHLQQLNIPVIANLPVGNNLQDHCSVASSFQLDPRIPTITEKLKNPQNILQYISDRSGPLTALEFASVTAFLSDPQEADNGDFPTYQITLGEISGEFVKRQSNLKPEVYEKVFAPYENKSILMCVAQMLQPKSRGTVRLLSTDPYDPPAIDPNYFEDPSDIQDVIKGLKMCQKIATSEPMKKAGCKPFDVSFPGCEDLEGDRLLECLARAAVASLSHCVGTAKMGDPTDPTTVVDPLLRVKKVGGLRVVDASVMPIVPSGNTNIPTIMVAEKAADIVKETIYCPPDDCA